MHSIKMPVEMNYICHAVETASGTFLISYGYNDFREHRVSELAPDFKTVIRSFEGKGGYGSSELYQPVYMTLNEDQCVFVADMQNSRVQKLGKDLTLKDSVSTDSFRPRRIFYDYETKVLIIGVSMYGLKFINIID